MELILASNSPRRKELLEKHGFTFKVISSEYEEKEFSNDPVKTAKTFSYNKAKDVFDRLEDKGEKVVLGADTVVYYKGKILGKPKSKEQAYNMLKTLSANAHVVITAYAIISEKKQIVKSVKTKVLFNQLSNEQIKTYLDSNLYVGKAGSYGIQDGYNLVKKYKGSLNNVIGLPVERLKKRLIKELKLK